MRRILFASERRPRLWDSILASISGSFSILPSFTSSTPSTSASTSRFYSSMSSIASSSTSSDEPPTPRATNVSDPLLSKMQQQQQHSSNASLNSSSASSSSSSTSDLIKEYVTTSPTIRVQNRNSKTTLALNSFLNSCPEIANALNEKQRSILANTILVDLAAASGWRDVDGERKDVIWDDQSE